jgi:hypothetical protein
VVVVPVVVVPAVVELVAAVPVVVVLGVSPAEEVARLVVVAVSGSQADFPLSSWLSHDNHYTPLPAHNDPGVYLVQFRHHGRRYTSQRHRHVKMFQIH